MYRYAEHAEWLNTPEGIKAIGQVFLNIEAKMDPAGCADMCALWPSNAGNSDQMMAAVDRVVEMGVIVEVEQVRTPWGQHRIFRKPRPGERRA